MRVCPILIIAAFIGAPAPNAHAIESPSDTKQEGHKAPNTRPLKPKQGRANERQTEQRTPSHSPDPAQIIEETMKRDKADPPSYQGQVSKRLDEYYAGSGAR